MTKYDEIRFVDEARQSQFVPGAVSDGAADLGGAAVDHLMKYCFYNYFNHLKIMLILKKG